MKPKNRVATIILMLLMCNVVIAAIPDTTSFQKVPNHLKKVLSLKMSFPQEASDNKIEGVVTTCFYLTHDGKVEVTCLNGPSILKEHVRRKMEDVHLKRIYALVNKPMIIRFRFENPLY